MAACPNCRQQIPEISEGKFCPFCGAPFLPEMNDALPSSPEEKAHQQVGTTGPGGEPSPAGQPMADVAEPRGYVHWEDRHRVGFLQAFGQTWSDSTFRPAEFFRRLPKTGNLGAALLYALLVGTTAGILSLFWQYLFWDSWLENSWPDITYLESLLGEEISRDFLGVVALLVPFFTLVGIFISSFIYHVCLLITGSGRHGLEATIRGYCYSYSAYLFVLFPFCGSLIALAWQYVLLVIGWREMHESTTGRVLLAVLLPFILCCGAFLFLGFLLARFAAPLLNLLPPCLLRTALGLPCPTCGSTRAGLALAQGDWVAAISYNPLFVSSLVILLAWSVASVLERVTGKSIPDMMLKKIRVTFDRTAPDLRGQQFLWWLVIGAIILNWIYLIVTT
jgi:hypothetical protein